MTRVLDFLLSTTLIVLLSPVLLTTMLVLKLTGEHEVFYLQTRIGRGGQPFRVIKFATMLKNSPQMKGGFLTQRGDPRVLPVGRILRRWKINELPQLFNVWAGSMSLVGPRPQAPVHYELYGPGVRQAIDRLAPGVTGVGSLVFRDEEGILERSGLQFDACHDEMIAPYKGQLEIWYARNRSIALYVKILVLTAIAVTRPTMDALAHFPTAPRPPDALATLLKAGD